MQLRRKKQRVFVQCTLGLSLQFLCFLKVSGRRQGEITAEKQQQWEENSTIVWLVPAGRVLRDLVTDTVIKCDIFAKHVLRLRSHQQQWEGLFSPQPTSGPYCYQWMSHRTLLNPFCPSSESSYEPGLGSTVCYYWLPCFRLRTPAPGRIQDLCVCQTLRQCFHPFLTQANSHVNEGDIFIFL